MISSHWKNTAINARDILQTKDPTSHMNWKELVDVEPGWGSMQDVMYYLKNLKLDSQTILFKLLDVLLWQDLCPDQETSFWVNKAFEKFETSHSYLYKKTLL